LARIGLKCFGGRINHKVSDYLRLGIFAVAYRSGIKYLQVDFTVSDKFGLVLTAEDVRLLDGIAAQGASFVSSPALSFWLKNVATDIQIWAFELGRRETEWTMEHAGKC
jgi:hypothetical protein